MAADVSEEHDLAAEKPDDLQRLTKSYAAWNAELASPLWAGGNKKNDRKQGAKGNKAASAATD